MTAVRMRVASMRAAGMRVASSTGLSVKAALVAPTMRPAG